MSGANEVLPTPEGALSRGALLMPAFWVLALLLAVGAVRMAVFLRESVTIYPVATVVAVVLFALYAVPFWIFVGGLDFLEREPPTLLATAFAWGALVATSVAIPGAGALHNVLAKLVSPEFAADWGAAIAGPTVEETVKVLGVFAIVLVAAAQVNSPLDGAVYGAMVGLGFQVAEDVVFAVNAVAVEGQGDRVSPVVITFFLRGFLAGLWSHTLFGALAGVGVGYLVVRTDRRLTRRAGIALLAFAGSWACHFLWNTPILLDGPVEGALGVLLILVIKGIPPLLLIAYVVRAAHGREADYYVSLLADLGDPEIATEAELRALGSGTRRAAARGYAFGRAGIRGRRVVRRLQQAQAHLAVSLSRANGDDSLGRTGDGSLGPPGGGETADVMRWKREVRAQRARLKRLGHPEARAPEERGGTVRGVFTAAGAVGMLMMIVWAAISALGGR
ncbi:RsiW-degrading membrane proteinase PrsW (M82 family) [Catenuloplanes nepalensis]|uniref:RsiW-degrading membrane proteinase PrsW (M82 family) n=1 Tax=Catenuloplanes nepalensis TaxID=587533 RepID=A0ABT9N3S9_9ACTN|nr:PrsW family intramembrane metalloprotease [Catenuloplanes nepalensis]MDP9798337.1 RsiW-degrading membrane proteinase PrsW (M82 family) [Catenuloplanes nepalensis]